jgi:hypothetical protein
MCNVCDELKPSALFGSSSKNRQCKPCSQTANERTFTCLYCNETKKQMEFQVKNRQPPYGPCCNKFDCVRSYQDAPEAERRKAAAAAAAKVMAAEAAKVEDAARAQQAAEAAAEVANDAAAASKRRAEEQQAALAAVQQQAAAAGEAAAAAAQKAATKVAELDQIKREVAESRRREVAAVELGEEERRVAAARLDVVEARQRRAERELEQTSAQQAAMERESRRLAAEKVEKERQNQQLQEEGDSLRMDASVHEQQNTTLIHKEAEARRQITVRVPAA